MVEDMVLLYVSDGLGELADDFVENRAVDLPLVDELAQGVAVDIVGDDRHADPGDILEVIYHHDVGVTEVVADVKLLLYHLAVAGVVEQGRLEGF